MAYSRIKTWIPGEVLTASNLNSEFNGCIANENDLDTRLTTEVTNRQTLENEYDAYVASLDSNLPTLSLPASTTISVFGKTIVDDANSAAVRTTIGCPSDPVAGTAGLRTLGTTHVQACAGNDARLGNERTPPNASVTQAKLKTSVATLDHGPANEGSGWTLLAGGEYGFTVQARCTFVAANFAYGMNSGTLFGDGDMQSVSFVGPMIKWDWIRTDGATNGHFYLQQRYVTSSGEINWLFILRNKTTKKVIEKWFRPDHPCFGNGGVPENIPHPWVFSKLDMTEHEIIVVNPSNNEIEKMDSEFPDKEFMEIITENYEIDEDSNSAWSSIPVTVGLPKHIIDKETGKKVLADYRFMSPGTEIQPIKKVILQPSYIKVKKLKRK